MIVRKNKAKVKERFINGNIETLEVVIPNISDHVMEYADNHLSLDEIINAVIDCKIHSDGIPASLFFYGLLSAKLKRLFSVTESTLAITTPSIIDKYDLNFASKKEFTSERNMRKFIEKIGSSDAITDEQVQEKIKEIINKNKLIKDENKKMIDLKDNSINSVLSIIEQIKRDYGIRFSYDDIRELVNTNHNLGRPDIAKLCVKYGYAATIQDAFDKYLIEAYNKTRQTSKCLQYQECLELIKNSGGIPVLAHPKSLELSEKDFLTLLQDMISCGLEGIEVYHSSFSKSEMDYYLEIANRYDLLISGGSDFHGKTVKPDVLLGTGKNNNIRIRKLSLLDKLHK